MLQLIAPSFARVLKFDPGQPRDNHGRFASTGVVRVGDRTVTVVKPARAVDDVLVPLNVAAFDTEFQRESGFYLGVGGQGGIGTRYERFGAYLAQHDTIEAPEVSVQESGRVGFTNGRHRYAWLRDQGVTHIPVAMTKESVRNAKQHGYLAATKFAWDESQHPRDKDGQFTTSGDVSRLPLEAPSPEAFIAARNKSTRIGYLSPLEPTDLKGYTLYLSKDGTVGGALSPKGDMGNLFNNGGPKGAAHEVLLQMIADGGKTADAYDGYLPKLYANFGLQETGRMKFNPEYAPKGWNFAEDDSPDVVFLALTGEAGTADDIRERVKDRSGWTPPVRSGHYYTDYDLAQRDALARADSRRTRPLAPLREDRGHRVDGHPRAHGAEGGPGTGGRLKAAGDEAQKGEHAFGNTQIPIAPTSKAATSLNSARAQIRDEDLMGTGKDVDPNHVTVRYGLLNENLDALRTFLASQHPFDAHLGAIDLFPASTHSDGAVPVVARIVSPELHAIEAVIGEHADFKEKSFPVYKPHCTLAYCKPEAAPRYANLPISGSFVVQGITISHASGVQETIPFGMTQKWDASRHPRDDKGQFTEVTAALDRVAQSKEFKAWFGNSQVVDQAGKPLVMWRGDPPVNEQLDKGGFLREGVTREQIQHPEVMGAKPAIYLTPNEDRAYYFATSVGEENYARPFFVKAEKIATPHILRDLVRQQPSGFDGNPDRETASDITAAEVALLQQHGYDALKGKMDWSGGGPQEIAVFSPTQVKGIENVQFDPKNPHIMKWEESKHPRRPKGSAAGGEFTASPSDAAASLSAGEHTNIHSTDMLAFLRKARKQHLDSDLTDLRVEGKRVFGGEGLGIDREDMPQIPRDHRQPFLKELADMGVTVTQESVDPLTLKPTQNKISVLNVADKLDTYGKKSGKPFPPLLVSSDGRILDGHHHWGMMAALALEMPTVTVPIFRLSIPTRKALALMRAYDHEHGIERKAFGQKADPASGRYVTPFVSFAGQGNAQLQLIASLNSSRLATWGFTAEAEVLGMARYRISAVLDGRTSEFCRFIDGTIFEVPDARRKVIEALNVQDPEDLRVVQPWPKQTKAAMAEFRQMEPPELTARGLHIPPYHPYCRTICRPIASSAGELAAEDIVDTIPVETEAFQAVTAADLQELGIEATQEQVDQWNAAVGMTPVELLSKFSNVPPQEVMTKGKGVGSNPITFDEAGNIGFNVRGADPQGVEFKLGAILDPFTSTYYLTQADLLAGSPKAEEAFLKNLFSSLIDMGEQSSATSVAVAVAGNAPYYAKLGFLPDELDWDTLRTYTQSQLDGPLAEVLGSLSAEDQLLVRHLLEDQSPGALQALVELPFTYEGKTVGEWLFEEASGTWALDLENEALVAQAKAYLT